MFLKLLCTIAMFWLLLNAAACVTDKNSQSLENRSSEDATRHPSDVVPIKSANSAKVAVSVGQNNDPEKSTDDDLEMSDEAVLERLKVLRTEAARLGEELKVNASKRGAILQSEIRTQLRAAEKKLAEIDAEISEAVSSGANDAKKGFKTSVGDALGSVGEMLKSLGDQIAQ